jgi:hypothetical protein
MKKRTEGKQANRQTGKRDKPTGRQDKRISRLDRSPEKRSKNRRTQTPEKQLNRQAETETERKRTKRRPTKWEDRFIFRAYDMARQGYDITRMGRALGVNRLTIVAWQEKHRLFRLAIDLGSRYWTDRGSTDRPSLASMLYKRLSRKSKALWEEINYLDKQGASAERVEALLAETGKRVRQSLFLYAWIDENFSLTAACRKVNISRLTVHAWRKSRSFNRLLDEISEAKKDFFESSLVGLVRQGDTTATVFANRTINADRGYGDRVNVNVSGQIEHKHIVSIDRLGLPVSVQRLILQGIRQAQRQGEISGSLEAGTAKHVSSRSLPAAGSR